MNTWITTTLNYKELADATTSTNQPTMRNTICRLIQNCFLPSLPAPTPLCWLGSIHCFLYSCYVSSYLNEAYPFVLTFNRIKGGKHMISSSLLNLFTSLMLCCDIKRLPNLPPEFLSFSSTTTSSSASTSYITSIYPEILSQSILYNNASFASNTRHFHRGLSRYSPLYFSSQLLVRALSFCIILSYMVNNMILFTHTPRHWSHSTRPTLHIHRQ